MNSEYEKIIVVFENCNIVEIPQEFVKSVYMDGVTERYWCNDFQTGKEKRAKTVSISLDKKALEIKTNLQEIYEDGNTVSFDEESFANHLDNSGS